MSDEPTPRGQPIDLKPSTGIRTNVQTLLAIIGATAITVGGLVSVKVDIAAAAKEAASAVKEASDARKVVEDIRTDLYKLRLEIAAFSASSSGTYNRKSQP